MTSTASKETKVGVDLARVRAVVTPVLAEHGVVPVDVAFITERVGWTLRLTIEREGSLEDGGGVTLEDCAEVSRAVSAVLDDESAEDLIPHQYSLEVSSPGLDRPLFSEADFARFVGRLARVKLARPAPDGQRLLRGPLDAAPAGRVAVVVDGKRIEVPFEDVEDANLVFELETAPKGSKKTKKSPRAPAKASRGKGPSGPARR